MLLHRKYIGIMITLLSIVGYGVFVFAVGPFAPGTELDPACSPYINNDPLQGVDTDCVVTAGGAGWELGGNAGTDDTVNFIGTTDAQDFVIRTNDIELVRLSTNGSIALGTSFGPFDAPVASGDSSFAFGPGATASGLGGIAIGLETTASAQGSTALGIGSIASETGSFAVGTNLTNNATASGQGSVAIGRSVLARSFGESAFGGYNTDYTPVGVTEFDITWDDSDRVFTVGNGPDNSNRSDAFTILKDGRVGIAYDNFETTPYDITDILQVNGRVRATDLIVENSNQTLVSYFSSNGPSTRLGINSNTGNVGFGLYINDYLWFSNAVVNYNGGAFDYAIYNDPQGTKALTIDGDTNFIGINFPNADVPAYQFDVNYPGSGIVAQFADTVGECTVNPTAGTFACSSDQRLKKNITPLESTTTLEKVLELQGVTYNWNSESDTVNPKIGFIAQQVEAVFPEFVSETGNGMKSVAYGSLTPVLVEAIKELNLKIESIESASSSIVVHSGFSLDGLRAWLGDVTNGIEKIFAREITTRSLCIEDDQGVTCLNRSQVDILLGNDSEDTITIDPEPISEVIPDGADTGTDADNVADQEIVPENENSENNPPVTQEETVPTL